MHVCSFSPFGYEGFLVTIEVDLRRGIPAVDMVGLADGTVRESRERMRAAIRNCGFDFPLERVLISLCPSDIKKEGAGFDLPIALSVLAAKDTDLCDSKKHVLVIGELELSGKVRGVRGIHAAVATALDNNISTCIIPAENYAEVSNLSNIRIFPVETLKEAFVCLQDCARLPEPDIKKIEQLNFDVHFSPVQIEQDLGVVKNQNILLRALQIAAAGGHNLMAYGPPGCGKTLAIQRFPSLLPDLQAEESRSVARIYSLAGLILPGQAALISPPFRYPHQSSSLEGIIGGGKYCLPGEISLAHNGVLFLDEASEFKSSVLQSLRVPLETGIASLVRAGRHIAFPAAFQLLIASNPCPCGNFGSNDKVCICNPRSVELFWRKFSAPLLDRIDIRVPLFPHIQESLKDFCPEVDFYTQKQIDSQSLRPSIKCAREKQLFRQKKLNVRLSPQEVSLVCALSPENSRLLSEAVVSHKLSKRAGESILKLARTLADMSDCETIERHHLLEAVFFRKNSGGLDICF